MTAAGTYQVSKALASAEASREQGSPSKLVSKLVDKDRAKRACRLYVASPHLEPACENRYSAGSCCGFREAG